jgi:hypothetical protein
MHRRRDEEEPPVVVAIGLRMRRPASTSSTADRSGATLVDRWMAEAWRRGGATGDGSEIHTWRLRRSGEIILSSATRWSERSLPHPFNRQRELGESEPLFLAAWRFEEQR